MIEIIEFGKRKTAECKECGCKFKYDDDIDTQNVCLTSNPPQYKKFINCPQCNYEIVLEATR